MDIRIKDTFIQLWSKYFNGAELPLAFYYSDQQVAGARIKTSKGFSCMVALLNRARKGEILCMDTGSIGCAGGKKSLGFSREIMPGFEYFLSCGIPGRMEGERYKKSPELVKEFIKNNPGFEAPARFIVFKRWDKLEPSDQPEAIVFFAGPDVLSGLFTLANFDEVEPDGVFAPFASGCGSIVQYPLQESKSGRPRAVLGLFDVTVRPYFSGDTLTFSIPLSKFLKMIENMEDSFLITETWSRIRKRM